MKFKSIFLVIVAIVPIAIISCSNDDDNDNTTKVYATDRGTFTDERDGETYGWVRYGDKEWMTENFRYDISSSSSSGESSIYLSADDYETNTGSTANLAKYGRLYNLQAAIDATPDGWRLPTDEDWQELEQCMGMSKSDAARTDWRGNIAHRMITIKGDTCDLNLLLGGYYTEHTIMGTPGWRFMGAYGYYWTSTADTTKTGLYYYCRKFEYNRDEVYRQSLETVKLELSVRYVRDAN